MAAGDKSPLLHWQRSSVGGGLELLDEVAVRRRPWWGRILAHNLGADDQGAAV
jgi:hypothetical protein